MGAPSERIRRLLEAHRSYCIDTMAFIYHFEGNPAYTPFTRPLFGLIESGEARGVASTLTLMELLVKPKRLGDFVAVEDYKYALANFPNLTLRSLDTEVAERAAEIRARHDLRTPDAIQVATALAEEAEALITNDLKLKSVNEVETIIMSEIIGTGGEAVS